MDTRSQKPLLIMCRVASRENFHIAGTFQISTSRPGVSEETDPGHSLQAPAELSLCEQGEMEAEFGLTFQNGKYLSSVHDFQIKKTPNVVQSLFRRELGLFGTWRNATEDSRAIDTIIHRELIQCRAINTDHNTTEVTLKSKTAGKETRRLEAKGKDFRLYIRTLEYPEPRNVIVLADKIFIKKKISNSEKFEYQSYTIDYARNKQAVLELKESYKILACQPWYEDGVVLPLDYWHNHSNHLKKHRRLFVLEKPGHTFRSYNFDTGEEYKHIRLDGSVKFNEVHFTENHVVLNSIKSSMEQEAGLPTANDFIVLKCPDLQFTRCKVTKEALNGAKMEVHGEFVYLTTVGRDKKVGICDLEKTIETSNHIQPNANSHSRVNEGCQTFVPATRLITEKPTALYEVTGSSGGTLLIIDTTWPVCCITKINLDDAAATYKFQLRPLFQTELGVLGEEHLNLSEPNVLYVGDSEVSIDVHPDDSARLIVSNRHEIRVISIVVGSDTDIRKEIRLEKQFGLSLKEEEPKLSVATTTRSGRKVNRVPYAQFENEIDQGVLQWEYCSVLDIFFILECSSTAFKIRVYDNQNWKPLAVIDLGMATVNPIYANLWRHWPTFEMDVVDGRAIVIRQFRTGTKGTSVAVLYVVNLLAQSQEDA